MDLSTCHGHSNRTDGAEDPHCKHHSSPELLSNHLHEALQDLNSVIKLQPRLFLGSKNLCPATTAMPPDQKPNKDPQPRSVLLPSMKTENSVLLEWKAHRQAATRESPKWKMKMLTLTLSKIAITSLEFSEVLPSAAFASLLVEMVAKLELVIEEVEELTRAVGFNELTGEEDDVKIQVDGGNQKHNSSVADPWAHAVSHVAE